MSHIVVVRPFRPGDEIHCKELIRNCVMSSMGSTFCGMLFKEITLQAMFMSAAMMFIFFGFPLTMCILAVPVIIILIYVGTYISFFLKMLEIKHEISNIPRIYMSNAFSCFWVAEVFEPYLMTRHPKDVHYNVMTEEQFRESNIDVFLQTKRIVGTIALCKSHRLDKGAWLKRLCVHKQYRRKSIARHLLNVAVQFAISERYSCANMVASEYTLSGKELCLKEGFLLKQIYRKRIIGSFVKILMYELTYQIRPGDDYRYFLEKE